MVSFDQMQTIALDLLSILELYDVHKWLSK